MVEPEDPGVDKDGDPNGLKLNYAEKHVMAGRRLFKNKTNNLYFINKSRTLDWVNLERYN